MFDHLSLGVKNMKASRKFYDLVLETLGYSRLANVVDVASGYGLEHASFWIGEAEASEVALAGSGTHIAFSAPTRWAVDAFHKQALELGGIDEGAPGLRPEYGEHYYAAFVLDLDGHKIEAVIRLPETN